LLAYSRRVIVDSSCHAQLVATLRNYITLTVGIL
jgi:hypothetical protein